MARITQSRRIVLFLLWSFNQSEVGKKDVEIFFNEKKNILYNSQSITKSTNIF